MKIILGTGSPRRKELFGLLKLPYQVVVSNADEEVEYDTYLEMVEKIAMKKAKVLVQEFPNDLVITADTIVVCDNQVLGKPKDVEEARRMITLLSGRKHEVHTAVSIYTKTKSISFVNTSKVSVCKISEGEIEDYIHSKEPYDKAGGYGIQGDFAKYIEKIDGDFFSVMGLPVHQLYQALQTFDLSNIE